MVTCSVDQSLLDLFSSGIYCTKEDHSLVSPLEPLCASAVYRFTTKFLLPGWDCVLWARKAAGHKSIPLSSSDFVLLSM